MSTKWKMKQDEVLIDFVRKHEALYNPRHKYYRNATWKQGLWNEIGGILNKTETDCLKRWCYVRDYYIRRKSKSLTGSIGEATRKRFKRLSFLDFLPSYQRHNITYVGVDENAVESAQENSEEASSQHSEANDVVSTKKDCNEGDDVAIKYETSDSESFSDEDMTSDIDSKDISNKDDKKKKETPIRATSTQERASQVELKTQPKISQCKLDENDLFFRSMAKIVKTLPRYEQAHLRMQISSLVGNAELRHIPNDQGPSTSADHHF